MKASKSFIRVMGFVGFIFVIAIISTIKSHILVEHSLSDILHAN